MEVDSLIRREWATRRISSSRTIIRGLKRKRMMNPLRMAKKLQSKWRYLRYKNSP